MALQINSYKYSSIRSFKSYTTTSGEKYLKHFEFTLCNKYNADFQSKHYRSMIIIC